MEKKKFNPARENNCHLNIITSPIYSLIYLPGERILKQINTMFHNFVWNGPAKIKHSIAIQSFEEGGISMIDVYAFEKTMKLTWLKKIVLCTGKCFLLVYSIFDVKKMMNLGKDYAEKTCKVLKNNFWKDVLTCYIMYISKKVVCKCEDILNMPLFYNHNFKIGLSSIYNKFMYDNGIRFVRDIVNTSGQFLQQSILENYIGTKINFLFYEGLIRTVKNFLSLSDFQVIKKPNTECAFISSYLNSIVFVQNPNQNVYKTFIINSDIPTCQTKWNTFFDNIEWKKVHNLVFNISKNTYTQWFQTRIVHRILGTKSLLYKMNILQDNLCTFCKENEETIKHLFWDCCFTQRIVNYVVEFLCAHNVQKHSEISCKTMILGSTKSNMTDINILMLELKKYIYLCQRKGIVPSIQGLTMNLTMSFKIQNNVKCHETELQSWAIVSLFADPLS